MRKDLALTIFLEGVLIGMALIVLVQAFEDRRAGAPWDKLEVGWAAAALLVVGVGMALELLA